MPPTYEDFPVLGSTQVDANLQCDVVKVSQTPEHTPLRFHDQMVFCEDGLLWSEANLFIASCDPGRGEWNTVMGYMINPDPKGALWAYDLSSSGSKPYPIPLENVEGDFHPLGIAILPGATKTSAKISVVNVSRDFHSCE